MSILVLQGVVQYLRFLISLASQLCTIWKISRGPRSTIEGSTPIVFVQRFWRRIQSGRWIWCQFISTTLVSNTLACWKNLEDSAPFLVVPLNYLISPTFSKGVPKWSVETCRCFPHNLVWESVPIFRRSPSFHRFASSIWMLCPFIGILGFLSLIFKRIRNSWRDCSATASDVPGSLLPTSVFLVSWRRKS